MEWTVNMHPGTENSVGLTRSEDSSTKENLNWCRTEHYLSDYCLMMDVNLVNPDELKTFQEVWHHPDPEQWENW